MSATEIFGRLQNRLSCWFSYRAMIRRLAFHLNAYSIGLYTDRYQERPEYGPQNIDLKRERVRQGGPFEPYSISVINRAATKLLGAERSILEVGCGTGMFSYLAAEDSRRTITALELDADTLRWALQYRQRPNIHYCSRSLDEFGLDAFDLVVAIELIEHVWDFQAILYQLSRVAPTAIITTPNKNRSAMDSIANSPEYKEHVREWTAGEFYWVLRVFYATVELYTIPGFKAEVARFKQDAGSIASLERCSVLEHSEPLIALCRHPVRDVFQKGG